MVRPGERARPGRFRRSSPTAGPGPPLPARSLPCALARRSRPASGDCRSPPVASPLLAHGRRRPSLPPTASPLLTHGRSGAACPASSLLACRRPGDGHHSPPAATTVALPCCCDAVDARGVPSYSGQATAWVRGRFAVRGVPSYSGQATARLRGRFAAQTPKSLPRPLPTESLSGFPNRPFGPNRRLPVKFKI
ncbi:hypothetical protein PVAP13_3KG362689 [Panicum virgatum]|uniref:Uncharacterized protein n=1 Tax=Panicum virgatum TaxID=38727 RepID=A0A8T0UVB1_PANVG|nr:hypothetical protein PVAP13_3KG362689 [Panicum virgatum]